MAEPRKYKVTNIYQHDENDPVATKEAIQKIAEQLAWDWYHYKQDRARSEKK